MTDDRYEISIKNIQDTVKWLIGSIGVIFVTLLAGVQFNRVPFTSDPAAAAAGAVAAGSVMITFALAIRTLVGGGMSFRDLVTQWRFKSARQFLGQAWADPPGSAQLERLWIMLQKKDRQIREKEITEDDPYYRSINALADELLRMARWHVVKSRFDRLVLAMMLLVPIELAAASTMFSQSETGADETTITIKLRRGA